MGCFGGIHLLNSLLHRMQDLTIKVELPVVRVEPLKLFRDKYSGQFCSSVHGPALYSEEDVELVVSRACQVELPPSAVVLVDTGSGAMTTDSMRPLKPFVQVWGCPVFLLNLGSTSRISTMFEYAAVIRQSYCRHDSICTCLCGYLFIHDEHVGGFCDTNTFHLPVFKDSKAPRMGLGEMATAYIVSQYARDTSLRRDLGKSLAFLKHAFISMPADQLVLQFGRGLLKEFEENKG